MSFSIKFLDAPVPDDWLLPSETGCLVEVTINDFKERDTVLTGYWDKVDYIKQWSEACARIMVGSLRTKSAFATAVHNPKKPNHGYVIHWWTAHKEGDEVYIRNQAVPYSKSGPPVDLSNIYTYIGERVANDDVSEWKISVRDVEVFNEAIERMSKS